MGGITAMVIVATVAYTIYRLFELFARRRERLSIIEKMSNNANMKELDNHLVLPPQEDKGSWAIRIGLLLIGVGLGIVIATIVDLTMAADYPTAHEHYGNYRNTLDVLYPACAALFGGVGLVVAYFVENKHGKNKN